jgi:hypothetical protein
MITSFRLSVIGLEETWVNVIRCPAITFGSTRSDPCTLSKDRPYREPAVGERATSFLHPLPFGHFLHQWQRILVHLVLLLRGARASVGCCKAERSSSTRVLRSHKGQIESDAPLRLRVANHGLLEAHLLRSILLNALSHRGLLHQASSELQCAWRENSPSTHLKHGLRVFNFH